MLSFYYPTNRIKTTVVEKVHMYKPLRNRDKKQRGGGAAFSFLEKDRQQRKLYWKNFRRRGETEHCTDTNLYWDLEARMTGTDEDEYSVRGILDGKRYS